jgi:hypothetical protein
VPLKYLDGMDSLLSIAQMPAGVPVPTALIGGARNAGLLVARILGASGPVLQQRMAEPSEPSNGLAPFSIEKYRSPGSQIEATRPESVPMPCGRGSAIPVPDVRGPTVAAPFVPDPGSESRPTARTRLASMGPVPFPIADARSPAASAPCESR